MLQENAGCYTRFLINMYDKKIMLSSSHVWNHVKNECIQALFEEKEMEIPGIFVQNKQ